MKILYSVQATGNGHISRAMELLPYLEQYGTVDIFLSGANSSLPLNAPIKYRSRGLSLFYTCEGKLDYRRMVGQLSPYRILKEANDLPVENYDLIINDFESITSIACSRKKVPSVNFGHQASFQSDKTPRPEKKNKIGEWILLNYARASQYIGLHFQCYDNFIFSPIVKKQILESEPRDDGYITVYLPSYCDRELLSFLKPLNNHRFEVFSREVTQTQTEDHVTFMPVDNTNFNKSLVRCHGLITGAGFETPAEALYLKKKIIAIPIQGQYEQSCNAAALERLGVVTLKKLDDDFNDTFQRWVNGSSSSVVEYEYSTGAIVDILMHRCTGMKYQDERPHGKLIFN